MQKNSKLCTTVGHAETDRNHEVGDLHFSTATRHVPRDEYFEDVLDLQVWKNEIRKNLVKFWDRPGADLPVKTELTPSAPLCPQLATIRMRHRYVVARAARPAARPAFRRALCSSLRHALQRAPRPVSPDRGPSLRSVFAECYRALRAVERLHKQWYFRVFLRNHWHPGTTSPPIGGRHPARLRISSNRGDQLPSRLRRISPAHSVNVFVLQAAAGLSPSPALAAIRVSFPAHVLPMNWRLQQAVLAARS